MAAHKAALCTVLCTCAVCRSWIWWRYAMQYTFETWPKNVNSLLRSSVFLLSSAALIWLTKYVIRQLNNSNQYPKSYVLALRL